MKKILCAFTLIELLIAISIGALVVYTALVGVRVASNAVMVSNRMALENGLLRVSLIEALQEVDFWLDSDNPNEPTEQPFRKWDANLGGMAFMPFSSKNDKTTGGLFIDTSLNFPEPLATTSKADVGGWNPHPLARASANPRTWTRSNYFDQEEGPKHHWGTAFIYSNVDPGASPHYWQAGQINNLLDTLGFWGMIEYLPSNTIFGYYATGEDWAPLGARRTIGWSGAPWSLLKNREWFNTGDGPAHGMKGRYGNTNGASYALPGPQEAVPKRFRKYYQIGYQGRDARNGGFAGAFDPAAITDFMESTKVEAPDVETRAMPELWPRVQYAVRRLIVRGQLINSVILTCHNPLDGREFQIPFICSGTTLRGARQQRDPNEGWAKDEYQGPSLDYPFLPYAQLVKP